MAQRGRPGLSPEQKRELWSRWKAGESLSEIGRALGKQPGSIHGVVASNGGYVPAVRRRSARVLTITEREEISRGLAEGASLRRIAGRLQRAPSSISREVARHERPPPVPGGPGAGAGVGPGPPPQALQARRGAPAPRAGGRQARRGVVARADLGMACSDATLASRIFRCRPRRSTAACSSRPVAFSARSSPRTCGPGAPCGARARRPGADRAAVASSTPCPSGSALPRPLTARSPATGRGTCSPAPPTPTSLPSSSARAVT